MADTPVVSVGKGDHWKSGEVVPVPVPALVVIWEHKTYFLLVFASKSGWLMENIALDLSSAIIDEDDRVGRVLVRT